MTFEEATKFFKVDQEVEGTVICKAHFGDFIELVPDQQFNVLLEIIVMENLTPEIYRTGKYSPLGSKVKALIGGFRKNDDYRSEIRLYKGIIEIPE